MSDIELDSQNSAETTSPFILKLGGSVISHSNKLIDFTYLREFRDLLRDQVLLGKKFVVTAGGGQTMRMYADYAKSEGNISNKRDLHWIGTAINTLHAEIIRGFFGDEVAEEMVWKYQHKDQIPSLTFEKPIVVAGGFEPGKSSDWVALKIAEGLKSNVVFDLKNIDGVYNKDPKEYSNAKLYKQLSWDQYLEIVGNKQEHDPGDNLPVDVVAASEAKQLGIEYRIIKGTDLYNFEQALAGEEFHGTTIK